MFLSKQDWTRTDLGGEEKGFHLGNAKFEMSQSYQVKMANKQQNS